jgi:hypothetical protein
MSSNSRQDAGCEDGVSECVVAQRRGSRPGLLQARRIAVYHFATHCPLSHGDGAMRFNHVGIPTTTRFEGEIDLPHLKVTVSDHQSNPFGIQWQRYWEGAPVPDLVKTVAHVAFEVDDLEQALRGQEVIIPPNSPSAGVIVAFIKVAGAPVELLQIDRTIRSDL